MNRGYCTTSDFALAMCDAMHIKPQSSIQE
jgi:hypothetical protein